MAAAEAAAEESPVKTEKALQEEGERLIAAAQRGDVKSVLEAVRGRQNLDYESAEGATALIAASQGERLDCIDALLTSYATA